MMRFSAFRSLSSFVGMIGICVTTLSPKYAAAQPPASAGMQNKMPAAAEDVSKKELKQFLAANEQLREMQMQNQRKVVKAIEDEGLSPERYGTIARSRRDTSAQSDVSEEEMRKAKNASDKIGTIQRGMRTQGTEIIEEEGLTPMRYQQIGMALQQKPDLQEQFKQLMQEEKQQGASGEKQ
ncbi:MAG: DUF4168 domain-containing protein [Chitinivibrionales bacterium]|nr:DUF4168 domain-containing protein [Chitinivibrionales bacterium]MBD3355574.1 DUF4168 domain-containing protein [Chitinivibrionales bacterium]